MKVADKLPQGTWVDAPARRPHLFDGDYTERSTPRASAAEVSQLRAAIAMLNDAVARLTARVRDLEAR